MKINRCLQIWLKSGHSSSIKLSPSSSIHQRNPDRAILPRKCPVSLADVLLRYVIDGRSLESGIGLSASELKIREPMCVCPLLPLAEETLRRGALCRSRWSRLGLLPAGLIPSVIFAVLHFRNGYGLLGAGLFGLSRTLLRTFNGSVISYTALHL